ncbi:hypothetical protein [Pseudomonas carassii]|uniref:Uncharacterized protein n=1 Tax=Pseudomonas carassii TaxID=3115855 RepID=A0ABU7HDT2_9PSED|nr:hypothetical protein [Pseudomonas sp. 137P]MEE1889475.1 hypothetical protein [Pseudomonas sp. 137P]
MNVDLSELKALATVAKRDPYDLVAANDYGMAMPPAVTLELIAEIERQRLINAEGCKPDSTIQPFGMTYARATSCHSLDTAEGCKPDLILLPPTLPSFVASSIRKAMEHSAAGGIDAEISIGTTRLRVTYHGIKWYHDLRHCNQWEPLAIEEFDNHLSAALNYYQAFEVDHD